MAEPLHTGSCRCGAVRFDASAEPHHLSYCHCGDCRKASGAPVSAFVGFMSAEVSIHPGDALRSFSNGPVTRSFCGSCGSPIAYEDARLAGRIYFMLGVMERPQDYAPTLHAWAAEQLPYLHISDGLPRIERSGVPRPTEQQS